MRGGVHGDGDDAYGDRGNAETEAGLAELERKRSELALEVAALHRVSLAQQSRVVLDVGGREFVTSVATLRSRVGSFLDALRSGRVRGWVPDVS